MSSLNRLKALQLWLGRYGAALFILGFVLFFLWDYKHKADQDAKFIKQSKITAGEIIGVAHRGRRDNEVYMKIKFLYKGKMIVGENRDMITDSPENIRKMRHQKVLIAYDSLMPTEVSMIFTKEQFKTYHLEMPDSLKNSNLLH